MVAKAVARSDGHLPSSVPAPVTSLLGRDRELQEINRLLAEDGKRIVTLLGPGGVGKTRIAIAVATGIADSGPESVLYLPAAHLRTRKELVAELGRALGVREAPGVDVEDAIAAALRDAVRLLLIDNLEQIPGAGVEISALLRACPALTVLATSRTPLRIAGERRFHIDPLPVDSDVDTPSPAVQLFVERASAVATGFVLTASNRNAVAAICRRVDGLPLAIELAAARSRALSPEALLARLTKRLTLLSAGPIDLPERQQTLQAAIDWSYDLLAQRDQRAFRRLATIPAPFTLDLASAVTGLDDDETLAVIDSLLDQSLLTLGPGDGPDPRFGMLQTIRDFGLDRAIAHDELDASASALAGYYRARASEIRAGLEGTEASSWRDWCTRERANIAAAIDWFVRGGSADAAVTLAGSLWRYWYFGGYYREGIATLERVLARSDDVPADARATAFNGLGALHFGLDNDREAADAFDRAAELWEAADDRSGLAYTVNNRALLAQSHGDHPVAIAGFERAIALLTALGDTRRLSVAEDNLGMAYEAIGQHDRAAELHARSLARSRASGDQAAEATASRHLSMALLAMGEFDAAVAKAEEARAIWERLGVRSQLAYSLNTLGTLVDRRGDVTGAELKYQEALALWRELEEPRGISLALHNLGACAFKRGDLSTSEQRFRESLSIRRVSGNPQDLAYSLSGFAGVALASGDPERAARLYACARMLSERHGFAADQDDDRPRIRRALGKARFDAAWKAGSAMSLDEAFAEIEKIAVPGQSVAPRPPAAPASPAPISNATSGDHGLTARELDVLRLVAAGKTNAEIGDALYISPFTAKTHVANLLGKLGVESRAAASTWAAQHGLT